MQLFPGARHNLLHEESPVADAEKTIIAEWIKR